MRTEPPARPPFVLRARLLTPLASGGTRFEPDAAVAVDAAGLISYAGAWSGWGGASPDARSGGRAPASSGGGGAGGPGGGAPPAGPPIVDLRPLLVMPGLVDLHAHLPQLPHAGLGAGLHLLDWLDRYIYPLERAFDGPAAARLAPAAYAAMAAAGTTTVVIYGAAWAASMDEAFRAAEEHGIRFVGGRVMMDRICYRDTPPDRRLGEELEESAGLCERWHGRDAGRLAYAFTPRFAVSCTAELLRQSAALARSTGAYWQTHLSEDRTELAEVAELFPDARDYLDVYDRAGGLGPHAIMAHAIHLSERELARLVETGTRVAHCPESNLFLASGAMRFARYRAAGLAVGLGSDVAAGPTLSLWSVMRAAAYTHDLLRATSASGEGTHGGGGPAAIGPLDWLATATLGGARALGLEDRIGSVEAGREADLIAVDAGLTAPVPGLDVDEPEDIVSRLVFRSDPRMVRAAWVRGRRLPGGRDQAAGGGRPGGPRA